MQIYILKAITGFWMGGSAAQQIKNKGADGCPWTCVPQIPGLNVHLASCCHTEHQTAVQECDIYLLDDVLAAVDASVAALLWKRAICGLLQSKTRLVRPIFMPMDFWMVA